MGIAASQARMLALTARKSNIEFQGQQINQQRTTLANESSSYNSQVLNLVVPTPPSSIDYTKTTYTLTGAGGTTQTISGIGVNSSDPNKSDITYTYPETQPDGSVVTKTGTYTGATITWDDTRLKSFTVGGNTYAPTVTSHTDNAAYDDAMNEYKFQKQLYEQVMNNINAKLEIVQQQDKTLELQLTQLDTEQKAVSTEEEAVKKVLEKNAEAFKTFA